MSKREYQILSELCLLDAAVTETNAVKLRFLTHDGQIKEITDDKYRPYFFALDPLTAEENEAIRLFSGNFQTVEKTDVFTGQTRVLSKIMWPNARIASRATERFRQVWEAEVDLPKSYVYDKGLHFGAWHSESDLKPTLNLSEEDAKRFEATFREARMNDQTKYEQLLRWFIILSQPIPNVNSQIFGVEDVDTEQTHAAWVLARIANIPLPEAFRSHHVSDWLKSIIHTYLRNNNILIPTSEELKKGQETHTVTGALTIAPKAGIYFNTVVCDFESLYPSCIDSFNLSYETINCNHPECTKNRIPDFDGHVCTRRRGFYAILVGALKELRIRQFKPASKDSALTEEERKVAAAAAKLLKLMSVSCYGVTVRIHGLACPPLAEAITGYGRYVLRESWQMAEKKGLRPLYGDTDSLFLDNASEEQVQWLIGAAKERFRLDLAVDKRYNLCVLPKAKKAYFGILPDGKPDIKGVTAMKSNAPMYIAKVFEQCVRELSSVRNQEEYVQATSRMKEIVKKAIARLKSRQFELADMRYSVKLYFDPNEKLADAKMYAQPYQCALQLIDRGRKLARGDTVAFVKVKPFNYRGRTFTVKPAEPDVAIADLNVDDYVRNLSTALEQAFEPMGIELKLEKGADISRWLS